MSTDLKIAQSQHYEGEDWWSWSVWLDAPAATLANVKEVVWRLHPTFPEPVRTETDRDNKFRLDTSGWGTFRVRADVVMNNGDVKHLHHDLDLLYPDGTPTEE